MYAHQLGTSFIEPVWAAKKIGVAKQCIKQIPLEKAPTTSDFVVIFTLNLGIANRSQI